MNTALAACDPGRYALDTVTAAVPLLPSATEPTLVLSVKNSTVPVSD